jgi:hypothetical protein
VWWIIEKLVSPFTAIVRAAAKRRIDEAAERLAVRRAVLREIVRLQFDAHVHAGKLSDDLALGLRQRVCDDLLSRLDLAKVDPEVESTRSEIAKAVAMRAVPLALWLAVGGQRTGPSRRIRPPIQLQPRLPRRTRR